MSQTTKPHLLVATTSYPLTDQETAGIFVARLNQSLGDYFDPKVVCPAGVKPTSGVEGVKAFRYAPRHWQRLAQSPGGIPVTLKANRWNALLVPPFLLSYAFSLIRELSRTQGVIAHWSVSGALAGLINLLFGRVLITVIHGSDANGSQGVVYRLMMQLALRLSDRVVCVSRQMLESLQGRYPQYAGKLLFIPNGVDEALLELERSPRQGGMKFLFLGNLNQRKGVWDLVEACTLLGNYPDWQLTIAGDGVEHEPLKEWIAGEGLVDRITLVGSVAPDRVGDLLAHQDVLVLPSYAEGRSSVLQEAMAAGLAVVASDIAANQELVTHQETGLLYPVGEVDRLADAMATLIRDADHRIRLQRAAREWIRREGLVWPATARAYADLYCSLIR